MENIDVLLFGSIYLDINAYYVPFGGYLPTEKEIVGKNYEAQLGGSATNSARALSTLGIKTAFIGKIGDDRIGNIISGLLEKNNINGFLKVEKEKNSNVGINLINESGKRVMVTLGNTNESLTEAYLKEQLVKLLPFTKYLYAGGLFKLTNLKQNFYEWLIDNLKKYSVCAVVDHGRITNIVSRKQIDSMKSFILSLSNKDLYCPSREEFMEVWGFDDLKEGLRKFGNICSCISVVKCAEKGACGLKGNKLIKSPSFKVKTVNTVGAGDYFNAGLIYANSKNKSFEESLSIANAVAAIKISRNYQPGVLEIEKFLKEISLKYVDKVD